MAKVSTNELVDSRDGVNKWMERFGVRFGVYKKGVFREQLFPYDSVPRIIHQTIGHIPRQSMSQDNIVFQIF